jgi:hypothetical protein
VGEFVCFTQYDIFGEADFRSSRLLGRVHFFLAAYTIRHKAVLISASGSQKLAEFCIALIHKHTHTQIMEDTYNLPHARGKLIFRGGEGNP